MNDLQEENPNLQEENPNLQEENPNLQEENPNLQEENPNLQEKYPIIENRLGTCLKITSIPVVLIQGFYNLNKCSIDPSYGVPFAQNSNSGHNSLTPENVQELLESKRKGSIILEPRGLGKKPENPEFKLYDDFINEIANKDEITEQDKLDILNLMQLIALHQATAHQVRTDSKNLVESKEEFTPADWAMDLYRYGIFLSRDDAKDPEERKKYNKALQDYIAQHTKNKAYLENEAFSLYLPKKSQYKTAYYKIIGLLGTSSTGGVIAMACIGLTIASIGAGIGLFIIAALLLGHHINKNKQHIGHSPLQLAEYTRVIESEQENKISNEVLNLFAHAGLGLCLQVQNSRL